MEESTESLIEDFKVTAFHMFSAVQDVLDDLKENKGLVLLTGGDLVMICDQIKEDSKTHSPKILADKFWQFRENRSEAEIQW